MGTEPTDFAIGQTASEADPDAALARRLRAAREARALSQQAVATRSKWVDLEKKGVSRTALIGYEAGTSRPGARELRLLCLTLGVTPNELMFGTTSPFEVTHIADEGMRGDDRRGVREAIELAFVLAALKGHERDALLSIALSLAGRQLGDLRLSGLRGIALLSVDPVWNDLRQHLPEGAKPDSLEDLIDVVSRGLTTNIGNRLLLDDDGDPVGGTWLYNDPKPPATD